MRVVLFTGKGGVGKTTTAAATAMLAAARGRKTLLVSTDAAHSVADVLRVAPSPDPQEVAGGLYVQQVDAQRRLEDSWGAVRGYLTSVLTGSGLDAMAAEELTVLPGAEELLALLEVRDQVRSGRWDAVVVDCAPTAETLRLLALPQALGWYLERLFPVQRRVARSLRPLLGRLLEPTGAGLPDDDVVAAVLRLHAELSDVTQCLDDAHTTVRVVLTPESVVVAEARRTLATLGLFGYAVDGVVVNRVFPTDLGTGGGTEGGTAADGAGTSWLAGWVSEQARVLADVEEAFDPLPIQRVPYAAAEPVGAPALLELATTMYGQADPLADRADPVLPSVERQGDQYRLSVPLPQAERSEVELTRVRDDLVITVAGFRRVWALPSGLRRCEVVDAALRDGRLVVTFRPDTSTWPSDG